MADAAIDLVHVSKAFGAHRVLDDVSLRIDAGRTTVIVGPSGTGKSVLLKHVVGLMQPDAGRIEVNGRLGALLDLSAGFHPDLTGRENAMLSGVLS